MMTTDLIFLWNNFGPMHADRVSAVVTHFANQRRCVGLEMYSTDVTYEWNSEVRGNFDKVTMFVDQDETRLTKRLLGLVRQAWIYRKSDWFVCHYDRIEIFVCAVILRILGAKVFIMGCSKFDDKPRNPLKELGKMLYLAPYHGALSSVGRPHDYFRFLGFKRRPVAVQYNTVSVARMRAQVADVTQSDAESPWVIVARLVPKKNLSLALKALSIYKENGGTRKLSICGSGPLMNDLRQEAEQLGILDQITFLGFVQTQEVSKVLACGYALILPSVEEQFGNVVIEAQALGLPVLLTHGCGAADGLVRSFVNGFIFEDDNPNGLAGFMGLLDQNKSLYHDLSHAAFEGAEKGDVAQFAKGVEALLIESGRK